MNILILAKRGMAAATLILMFSLAASAAFATGPDCSNIPTDKGGVSGKLDKKTGVCVYKGIPFAAPPVGELRFAAPRAPEPWAETLEAYEPGGECLQFPMGVFSNVDPIGKEDCLYLNVWQPAQAAAEKKPVMVFIHGGGFVMGSGSQPWYESSKLSAFGDVVVVTINYRLGPFGFLAHPALRDEAGRSGNYGFLDQIAALKWVNKNIGAFGGDAGNVTIFGESAGGMSVAAHLASPLSRGLFQKAIIESGPATSLRLTQDAAEKKGITRAADLGCTDDKNTASCLRSVDAVHIMKTLKPVMALISDSDKDYDPFSYVPVVDGSVIPGETMDVLSGGNIDTKVKVMLGATANEAALFTIRKRLKTAADLETELKKDEELFKKFFNVETMPDKLRDFYKLESYATPRDCYNTLLTDVAFTCPTVMMSNALSARGVETYQYLFSKHLSDSGFTKGMGAFHGSDLFFVFGNFSYMGISMESKENLEVSKDVMSLWTSFARGGVPAAPGGPAWPLYKKDSAQYLDIDKELKTGANLKAGPCAYMEDLVSGTDK